MTMASFVAQLPEAELHLHLEGAVSLLIPAHNRELGLARGMEFLEKVLRHRPPEVVGIGLDYAERPHPPGPTTTLHTTRWRDLRSPHHAIRRMIEAGLRVTVNTDDPGLFGTNLNREFVLIADAFGLSETMLAGIAANAFSHNWSRPAQDRGEVELRAAVSR
jgi:hypothetical protein